MAQAGSQSLLDLMFGKGRGDNAVTQEEERRKKAEAEAEAQRKAAEEKKRKSEEESLRILREGSRKRGSAAQDLQR